MLFLSQNIILGPVWYDWKDIITHNPDWNFKMHVPVSFILYSEFS